MIKLKTKRGKFLAIFGTTWTLCVSLFLYVVLFQIDGIATKMQTTIIVTSIILGVLSFLALNATVLGKQCTLMSVKIGLGLLALIVCFGLGWKGGYKSGIDTPLLERFVETCKRTEPYDAPLELLRAMDLVIQKYDDSSFMSAYEKRFYQAISKCVQLSYSNLESVPGEGVQGVFLSNSSTNQKILIEVDKKYSQTDDLTIALLLSHELTHAKQFVERTGIDYFSSAKIEDRLNDEVEAFRQTLYFTANLNKEESDSLVARAEKYTTNSQLAQYKDLLDVSWRAINTCKIKDTETKTLYSDAQKSCYGGELTRGLTKMVLNLGY